MSDTLDLKGHPHAPRATAPHRTVSYSGAVTRAPLEFAADTRTAEKTIHCIMQYNEAT